MEDSYQNEIKFENDIVEVMDSESVRKYPNRCAGVIYARHGKISSVGTGFLIASNLVVTVAHNIYSRELKSFLSDLTFFPAVSGKHNQKGGLKVVDWRLPQEYISNEGIDPIKYDFALLKLEANVEGAEFLGMGGNYVNLEEEICLIGYPSSGDPNYAYQSCHWKSNTHSIH